MKFQDKANPYFGGGKMTPQEWVNKDIKEMKEKLFKDEFEPRDEEHYGITEYITYRILIAGGGPVAWYDIKTQDGEIIGGTWHYSWYGDDENVELSNEEAEYVVNYFGVYVEGTN